MKQSTNLKPIESNVKDFISHEVTYFLLTMQR